MPYKDPEQRKRNMRKNYRMREGWPENQIYAPPTKVAGEWAHGISGYTKHSCRCEVCKAAKRTTDAKYKADNPEKFLRAEPKPKKVKTPKKPKKVPLTKEQKLYHRLWMLREVYAVRECSTCGKEYHNDNHTQCHRCRSAVPCPSCDGLKTPKADVCSECLDTRGEKNPRWRGGTTHTKKGYVMVYFPSSFGEKGRYKFQHVVVMEDIVGRELFPNENVHHINGVRDDNRPENLELWTVNQPAGQRVEDLVQWAKELLMRYEPDCLI